MGGFQVYIRSDQPPRPTPPVNEIVYAKWDDNTYWYLAQVVSLDMDLKTHDVHFMDDYDKDQVIEKKLRKVFCVCILCLFDHPICD